MCPGRALGSPSLGGTVAVSAALTGRWPDAWGGTQRGWERVRGRVAIAFWRGDAVG